MTPNIRWYLADGTTPAPGQIDWGFVGPGQSGEAKTYVFRNEGDTPATCTSALICPSSCALRITAWIEFRSETSACMAVVSNPAFSSNLAAASAAS